MGPNLSGCIRWVTELLAINFLELNPGDRFKQVTREVTVNADSTVSINNINIYVGHDYIKKIARDDSACNSVRHISKQDCDVMPRLTMQKWHTY